MFSDSYDVLKLMLLVSIIFVIISISSIIFGVFDSSITKNKVIENKDTFNTYHTCYYLNDVYYCK